MVGKKLRDLREQRGLTRHELAVRAGVAPETIEAAFRSQLRLAQPRELAAGVSILGPHRDDLAFLVDERDMNTFGSRGAATTFSR